MVNVNPAFPCKKCTHLAHQHFKNVSAETEGICLDCVRGKYVVDPNEHWHLFEGDNLKYMELQTKRQELRNG